jgi:hypothetical protein
MEWRKGYQEKKNAFLTVNADFSAGTLRGRKGFDWMAPAPLNGRLHVTEDPLGARMILSVGSFSSTNWNQWFTVYNSSGGLVGSQNLTSDFGETPRAWGRVGFVNVELGDGTHAAHFVSLVSTESNVYVYDPYVDPGALRLLQMSERPTGDQYRGSDSAFGYSLTRPSGGIMEEHQKMVFYAGFAKDKSFLLSKAIEEDQGGIRPPPIGSDRTQMIHQRHEFCWSSGFDGVADVLDLNFTSTENNERITGLKSFQGSLTVFTESSIYAWFSTPYDRVSTELRKVDSGHGCVAHNSIVEVGGVLYFMTSAGVFAYGGLSAPHAVKISSALDPLWLDGSGAFWVPEEMETVLVRELGWPWKIDHGELERCNGLHVAHMGQIWWSVPLVGSAADNFGLTLVFDYVRTAWSVFASRNHASGPYFPMADGCVVEGNHAPVVFTTGGAELRRYGGVSDSMQNTSAGVPLIWLSNVLNDTGAANERVRDVRFNLLSWGKAPGIDPPRVVICGEESHMDMQQGTRQEKAGDLKMHPDESLPLFFLGDWKFDSAHDASPSYFSGRDWFLSKFNARVTSPSWRVGIVDDCDDQGRRTILEMRSFAAEIKTLGTE